MVTFRSKFCEEREEGKDQTGWTSKSSSSWSSKSNQTGNSWTSSSNMRNEKKGVTFLPAITEENEKKKSY